MTTDPRVDDYLAGRPADQQETLGALRADVARLAPDADETISYGMPTFKLDGKFLLSYAGWKRHCSVYPMTDTVVRRHAEALEGYGRTKGSLHFSKDQPLPDGVLEDLVAERVADVRSGSAR